MNDGVAKSLISGVAAVFQDLDIHNYCLAICVGVKSS